MISILTSPPHFLNHVIENNDKKIHVNRELRIKDYCFNLNGMFDVGYKNDWGELDLAPCKTISKLELLYCALTQKLPAGAPVVYGRQLLSASPFTDSDIFLRAAFSICLMRSLVTPNLPPISSSV